MDPRFSISSFKGEKRGFECLLKILHVQRRPESACLRLKCQRKTGLFESQWLQVSSTKTTEDEVRKVAINSKWRNRIMLTVRIQSSISTRRNYV